MSVRVIGDKWSVEAYGLCDGGQCFIAAVQLANGEAKPRRAAVDHRRQRADHTYCSQLLTSSLTTSWVKASHEDAGVLARAIVLLVMSQVSMPPDTDHDVADDWPG
jgi:Bacterial Tetracyclin repressor,  C-terminal domain